MKSLLVFAILLLSFTFANAQHEYAPLQEHEFKYRDWTYKSVRDDREINLRDFTKNKKLVMVVYFAAWCANWKFEAQVAQKLYDKYKSQGFDVIGISEYETVEKTKANLEALSVTFPVVYESLALDAREKTLHYEYRQETKDKRKWGSPWNLFIETANIERKGDTLLKKAFVVNGELIEADAEKFIRQKLGLPAEEKQTAVAAKEKEIEVCETEKSNAAFKKP